MKAAVGSSRTSGWRAWLRNQRLRREVSAEACRSETLPSSAGPGANLDRGDPSSRRRRRFLWRALGLPSLRPCACSLLQRPHLLRAKLLPDHDRARPRYALGRKREKLSFWRALEVSRCACRRLQATVPEPAMPFSCSDRQNILHLSWYDG